MYPDLVFPFLNVQKSLARVSGNSSARHGHFTALEFDQILGRTGAGLLKESHAEMLILETNEYRNKKQVYSLKISKGGRSE